MTNPIRTIMATPVALRGGGSSSQRRRRTHVDAESVNSSPNPRPPIHPPHRRRPHRDRWITRAMVPATALEIIDRDR
jgi:hypothetical protein